MFKIRLRILKKWKGSGAAGRNRKENAKNALQTAGAELQGVWNDNQQLVYRGYLLVRAFTWARRDSMLD